MADPLGQFAHVNLRHIVGADHPHMHRIAQRLVIDSGRDNYAHPGFVRGLGGVFRIASQLHRARIDETVDAESFDLLELLDQLGHLALAVEARGIEFKTRHPGREMFMNQGETELARLTFSEDCIDRHLAPPSLPAVETAPSLIQSRGFGERRSALPEREKHLATQDAKKGGTLARPASMLSVCRD